MDRFNEFVDNLSQEYEIINMYKDKHRWKIKQISEISGISVAGIYRVLEKYGINPHRRNLNDTHAIVGQYYLSGTPINKISELTGYSRRQVYYIIANEING